MDSLPEPGPRPRLRWRFGAACFDEASLLLSLHGSPVELERRPLQLLALLLAHAGEIVTKDEILDALWPGREVSEAALTTTMARLRTALGQAGQGAIRTVHGYGYRFVAPVEVTATAPSPAVAAPSAALAAGDPVAHRPGWFLAERLGAGGHGDAWLAVERDSGARRVVKFAHGAEGLAALRREVALGRLLAEGLGQRPDLMPILGWQLKQEPAFIELPWAEHGNLAEWAERQGGAASLPLDLRLDLAAQIAEALAACHSMAVLHKDLKPANVLIRLAGDGRPAIALTDFGSGRAMDPARLAAFGITQPGADQTGAESSGGTHMYTAPEVYAGAPPTVQADVFSLGVILFQLAAGDLRRPLAAGWDELIADPLLREDIAAAAAGDPARRLDDAGTLAQRLRSLPARRQARAAAEAAAREAARLRRALELHRARRGMWLALGTVLLLGFVTSTALYLRAEHARSLALHAQAAAERQAARAEAVTSFLTDDLLSAANPLLTSDPNIPVRRLLGLATTDLARRFPQDNPDRAAIELAIGGAYAGLADADHALPLLRAALATLRAQLGEDDPRTQSARLAMARLAEHMLDPAAMREAGAAILAAHPRDPQTALTGRLYQEIGGCALENAGEACIMRLQPLLADATRALGARHALVLRIQAELARQLGDAGHATQAIPMARDAVAGTTQLYGPDHLLTQERRFDLAQILVQAGMIDEAIATLTDIRARLLAVTGTETELSARVANQLGMAYCAAHRCAESLGVYQQALDTSVRARGETANLSIAIVHNTAQALASLGRMREAIGMAQRALDLWRRAQGPDSVYTLRAENNLAVDERAMGDLAPAETLLRDVVTRGRRVFTHGDFDLGKYETELAEVLIAEHKNAEAAALLEEAVGRLTKALGAADGQTTRAAGLLASLRGDGR